MRFPDRLAGLFKLRRLFLITAVIVVFVTTYSLILPAITMERKTYCGLEEHEHTEECYTITRVCVCGQDEVEGHEHTDDCYTEEQVLVCELEENDAHTHTDDCYETERILLCGKQEAEGHTHDDSCFEEERELTCGMEEHIHSEECFVNPDAETETPETETALSENENPFTNDQGILSGENETEYSSETPAEETTEFEAEESETEPEETETSADERAYPAVTLKEKIKDGLLSTWIEVIAEAPEGVLPEGTALFIEPYILEEDEQEKFDTVLSDTVQNGLLEYKTVRISFIGPDGAPVIPNGDVQLFISDDLVEDAENLELVSLYDHRFDPALENISIDDPEEYDPTAALIEIDPLLQENVKKNTVTYLRKPEDPEILAVCSTSSERTLEADGNGYHITMTGGAKACIPQDAKLSVREIRENTRDYDGYVSDAEKQLEVEEGAVSYARFFDITIVDARGWEIQPKEAVDVKIVLDDLQDNIDENAEAAPQVVHFGEDENETVEAEQTGDEVSFAAEGFSVYGVVYTVDFHWEVNGRMFEFSIPGGGFVSFYNLLEVLNIVENDPDTETDEIQELVDGIENIDFSSPELVSVSKITEDTTVGAIKERLRLECEYSAELTEEQIAEINAQEAKAGDWALISLKAFDTEESLAVTMKNGDTWTVRVTDAQKPYKDVESLETGTYIIYNSFDSSKQAVFMKNDGTSSFTNSTTGTAWNAADLSNYTWRVTKNNNGTYTIKSTANNIYINLYGDNNEYDKWASSSSANVTLVNHYNSDGVNDGISIRYNNKYIQRNQTKGFFVRTDLQWKDVNLTFYKIEENSSGGSTGTPGIVLTDEQRAEMEKWKETLTKFNTLTDYDKTAEVYDEDDRVYKIDITADSGITDFYKNVDLGFVLDVSNSMKFPSSLKALEDNQGNEQQVWMTADWLDWAKNAYSSYYNQDGCFYIISDPALTSTIYKVWKDGNQWKYQDASENPGVKVYNVNDGTVFKEPYRQAYTLYYADDKIKRMTYLQNSVVYAVDTLKKIVTPTEHVDDNTATVQVAYNFFAGISGSNNDNYAIRKSQDFVNLRSAGSELFTVSPAGNEASGTRQDLALYDTNNDPKLAANEFSWHSGYDKYVILVTDGAPNGASMSDVVTAANRLKSEDGVKLITIGLSTKDVDGGSQMLKSIANDVDGDGVPEFYEAEKAKDLEYILLRILRSIMAKGLVRGKITDTIDKGFYPVDVQGNPLIAGVYKNGGRVQNAQISDYVSGGKPTDAHANEAFYTWEQVGDEWKITWYNQEIGWNDNDSTTGNPWTGTVYVKAKEDYLGGNLIETNDGHAQIEPTGLKLVINGTPETNWRPLEGMTPIDLPVPRVNVHNLETKENSTTWTVYKGTSVTPKEQIEALWNAIPIEEVVSSTQNNGHKITTGQSANVGSAGAGETFTLGSVMSEAAPDFNVDNLINQITSTKSSASQEFPYTAYGHESGKITVKVERTIGDQNPSTHTADTVGTPVEQYKVTFTYKPYTESERKAKLIAANELDDAGKNNNDYHNGSNGRGTEETGEIKSENTHTINVYAKPLEVAKVKPAGNDSTSPLSDKTAAFSLYRKWRAADGDANKVSLKGYSLGGTVLREPSSDNDYFVLVESKTTVNGFAKFTTELSAADAPYYLAETSVPDGYAENKVLQTVTVSPGPNITTTKTLPSVTNTEEGAITTTMPYDWTQGVRLSIDGAEAVYVDGSGTQIIPAAGGTARDYVLPTDPEGYFRNSVLNIPLGYLQIHKQVTFNNDTPSATELSDLKGDYEFTVYTDAECTNPYMEDGQPKTLTITIDETDHASSEVIGLPIGEYWIKEDSSVEGVLPNANKISAPVTADRIATNPFPVSFTNNKNVDDQADKLAIELEKKFTGLSDKNSIPPGFKVVLKYRDGTAERSLDLSNEDLGNVGADRVNIDWSDSDGGLTWHWRVTNLPYDATDFRVSEDKYDTAPGYDWSGTTLNDNPVEDPSADSAQTVLKPTVTFSTVDQHEINPDNDKTFYFNEDMIWLLRATGNEGVVVISVHTLSYATRLAVEDFIKTNNFPQSSWADLKVSYYSREAHQNGFSVHGHKLRLEKIDPPHNGFDYQLTVDKNQSNHNYFYRLVYDSHSDKNSFKYVNDYSENSVSVDLVKVDRDDRDEKLSGAVFSLRKLTQTEGNPPAPLPSGEFAGTDLPDSAPTKENTGKTSFEGLTQGYYEITEKTPPAGYVLTDAVPVYFRIENGVVSRIEWSADQAKWIEKGNDELITFEAAVPAVSDNPDTPENESADAVNAAFTIGNTPGSALPSTGGPGSRFIILLGAMFVLAAGGILVLRLRRSTR